MTYSADKYENEAGLSFQEKSVIVSLLTSTVVYAVFAVLVWQRYRAGSFDTDSVLVFWGRALLILIGLQIIFQVVTQILLAIFHTIVTGEEEDPSFEDERDKLIELKATRNQFVMFGAGVLLATAALAFGLSVTVMFVTLIAFLIIAELFSSVSKLVYYRRGV
jgi:hypothetical protein